MATTVIRPRGMRAGELAKVGVDLVHGKLACRKCGVGWSPEVGPTGRRVRGWWRCPQGCMEWVRTGNGWETKDGRYSIVPPGNGKTPLGRQTDLGVFEIHTRDGLFQSYLDIRQLA